MEKVKKISRALLTIPARRKRKQEPVIIAIIPVNRGRYKPGA